MKDEQSPSKKSIDGNQEAESHIYLDREEIPLHEPSSISSSVKPKSNSSYKKPRRTAKHKRHLDSNIIARSTEKPKDSSKLSSFVQRHPILVGGLFTILSAIITGLFTLGGSVIEILPSILEPKQTLAEPAFNIPIDVTNPKSAIIINLAEGIAITDSVLDVQIDNDTARDAAYRIKDTTAVLWHFVPSEVKDFTEKSLQNGKHKIRIGIPGQEFEDPISIVFSNQIPLQP